MIKCDGRYYVFGTGRDINVLISDDGFNWRYGGHVFTHIPNSVHSAVPLNTGDDVWAPDVTYRNGQYYLYYAVSHWDSFVSAIGLVTSPTLDPDDPNYKWTDRGIVVNSVAGENLNAIDPCIFSDPNGSLWLSYGSYHGNIELVQLDPITGLRTTPKSHVWIVANHSEASYLIFHDHYYYLLTNHGTCCQGPRSTYNIRVGRSSRVTGPFLDRNVVNMASGGGSLFLSSRQGKIGPGQFGYFAVDGVEKFTCHYESDAAAGGRSALGEGPLLWTGDGWPVPGQDVTSGQYQIRSSLTGTVLQRDTLNPADASVANLVRLGDYTVADNQEWTIEPDADGCFDIRGAQNDDAAKVKYIGESPSKATVIMTSSSEAAIPEWKLDQLPDSNYRIVSKDNGDALTALITTDSNHTLTMKQYDGTLGQQWQIVAP